MKTLILTGFDGDEYGRMASCTLPLMRTYAERHGHDFRVVRLAGERPPSWMKVAALVDALGEYDCVAWLDIDVVIVSPWRDLLGELLPDTWQALVEHRTECGHVPNCGVWVVTKEMRYELSLAWGEGTDYLHHPWWEQAAMMRLMGYAVEPGPRGRLDTPTSLYERTTFLSPRWNHHSADEMKVPDPYFVHVTQYADRLGAIRDLAASAART